MYVYEELFWLVKIAMDLLLGDLSRESVLAFYNLYPVSLIAAASYFTLSVARRAATPRTPAHRPWLMVATVSGVEQGGGEYIKDQAGWCRRSHGMAEVGRNNGQNGRGGLSEDTGRWISIVSHRTRFSPIFRKTKQPSNLQPPPHTGDE